MKIAVLFVGEYRTFPYCRKTMNFLDQLPNNEMKIDVYFHTWESTKMYNPPIGHHLNTNPIRSYRLVPEDEIRELLNQPAVVKISPVPDDRDGFLIMRKGWLLGFELIKESGIEYDFVYVLRPDLFFRRGLSFTNITFEKYKNSIGFLPQNRTNPPIIADCDFFSTYENIKKILTDDVLLLDQANEGIHRVWFEYVKSKGFNITTLPFVVSEPHCIARFPMTQHSTWREVEETYWALFHNRPI